MAASRDILATYRGPRRVVRRLRDMGEHEGRALAMLMAACVLLFVAQWPRLSRQAFETGQELAPLMGATLLAVVVFLPLVFYLLALLSRLILRLFGWAGNGFGARLALFWALLASSPLALLYGLTAGFVGPGAAVTAVYLVWGVVFM